MEEPNKFCFTSNLFEISVGEDADTNPGMFGRDLAKWLTEKFRDIGYSDAEYDAEDWGWYVSCTSDPYPIFIACGNFVDYTKETKEYDADNPPRGTDVVWQCFVGADRPFLRNLFKKLNVSREVEIENQLFQILGNTEGISRTNEP